MLEDLHHEALASLHGRHLLATQDLSDEAIDALLALARTFARLHAGGVRTTLLPDTLGYALFFDKSTRTKSAWAGAAARLGMHPVIVDGSTTQVAHGETAEETGAMLGMNAHALGVRHDLVLGEGHRFMADLAKGIGDYLASTGARRHVPVVNLQCDIDHPTQTLADLAWIRERLGALAGRRITISWAYSPSYAKPLSVPQGLVMLLSRFGAHLTLAHPPDYPLLNETLEAARANAERSGGSFRIVHDMDEAFRGAQVVYPKSWGPLELMRERAGASPEARAEIEARALANNARYTDWICDERRMALTDDALWMHCLPADIGAEVSPGVMERFRVDVAREANHKVFVIMAMLAASMLDDVPCRLARITGGRHG